MPVRSLSRNLEARLSAPLSPCNDAHSSCSSCEIRTTTTKKKASSKKQLRFSSKTDEVQLIEHINDMSSQEVEAIWYTSSDFSDFMDEVRLTAFLDDSGRPIDPKKHCLRGLEHLIDDIVDRWANKRAAINAVMDEQDRQWAAGVEKPELLRKAYMPQSTDSATTAHERAVQDEKDAFKVLKTIMPPSRRMKLKKESEVLSRERAFPRDRIRVAKSKELNRPRRSRIPPVAV